MTHIRALVGLNSRAPGIAPIFALAQPARSVRLLGPVGIALICVTQASAQQPTPTVPLPPVTVESKQLPKRPPAKKAANPVPTNQPAPPQPPETPYQAASGAVKGYVAKQSTTGTKTGTPLIETPQSISVVTKEQTDQQGVTSISEALRYTPGVIVDLRPSSRFDIVPVRGFGPHTGGALQGFVGYQDGLRLQRGIGFAAPAIEPFALERIEVLRGPASVLYGQGIPGGFVNVISKKPVDGFHGEIETSTNNYGKKEIGVDVNTPLDPLGKAAFRVVGLARDSETQVNGVGDQRYMVAPSLTLRPSASTTFSVLAHYQYDPASLYSVFLPAYGTLFNNTNGQIPRNFNPGDPSYEVFKREVKAVGYQFEHRFNDALTVRQNLRYMNLGMTFHGVSTTGAFTGTQKTIARQKSNVEETADTFTVDNQAQLNVRTGPVKHQILMGVDYQFVDAARLLGNGTTTAIDYTNPVYGNVGALPAFSTQSTMLTQQTGVYIQEQAKIGNWVALLGGRYDTASFGYDETTLSNGSKLAITQTDHAFTWRSGLVYRFANGLAPYASYSTSFEPVTGTTVQSIFGFGQSKFLPTTGEQYEVGLKYEPVGWNMAFTLAAFDLTKNNVLTPDSDPTHLNKCGATGTTACSVQTGQIEGRGIELEAKGSLNRNIDFVTAYTYQQTEVTKSNTAAELGKRPIQLPEHTASAWGNYTFREGPFAGLGIGLGVRYLGASFGDTANTIEVPSVVLYDAGLQYDFSYLDRSWKGYTLTINAKNLLDTSYIASCGAGFTPVACYWGVERTVEAKLRYRW